MSVRGNARDCGNYTIYCRNAHVIRNDDGTYRRAGGDDGLRGGGAYTYQTHFKSQTKSRCRQTQ